MSAVTLVVHNQRPNAAELARQAAQWLQERGHEVRMPEADAEAVKLRALAVPDEKLADDVVLAVSLGGDGTMLRTVDLVEEEEVPVLGVNVGLLGYLTEVEPNAMTLGARALLRGRLRHRGPDDAVGHDPVEALDPRRVELSGPERGRGREDAVRAHRAHAREHRGRGVHLLRGRRAHRRDTDRLDRILAVGAGPIVSPRHRALLLTPVSPHMLFDRSLILDPGEPLSLEVIGHRPATLSVDGTSVGELERGRHRRLLPV